MVEINGKEVEEYTVTKADGTKVTRRSIKTPGKGTVHQTLGSKGEVTREIQTPEKKSGTVVDKTAVDQAISVKQYNDTKKAELQEKFKKFQSATQGLTAKDILRRNRIVTGQDERGSYARLQPRSRKEINDLESNNPSQTQTPQQRDTSKYDAFLSQNAQVDAYLAGGVIEEVDANKVYKVYNEGAGKVSVLVPRVYAKQTADEKFLIPIRQRVFNEDKATAQANIAANKQFLINRAGGGDTNNNPVAEFIAKPILVSYIKDPFKEGAIDVATLGVAKGLGYAYEIGKPFLAASRVGQKVISGIRFIESIPRGKAALKGVKTGAAVSFLGGLSAYETNRIISSPNPRDEFARTAKSYALFGQGFESGRVSGAEFYKNKIGSPELFKANLKAGVGDVYRGAIKVGDNVFYSIDEAAYRTSNFLEANRLNKKGAVFRSGKRISPLSKAQIQKNSLRQSVFREQIKSPDTIRFDFGKENLAKNPDIARELGISIKNPSKAQKEFFTDLDRARLFKEPDKRIIYPETKTKKYRADLLGLDRTGYNKYSLDVKPRIVESVYTKYPPKSEVVGGKLKRFILDFKSGYKQDINLATSINKGTDKYFSKEGVSFFSEKKSGDLFTVASNKNKAIILRDTPGGNKKEIVTLLRRDEPLLVRKSKELKEVSNYFEKETPVLSGGQQNNKIRGGFRKGMREKLFGKLKTKQKTFYKEYALTTSQPRTISSTSQTPGTVSVFESSSGGEISEIGRNPFSSLLKKRKKSFNYNFEYDTTSPSTINYINDRLNTPAKTYNLYNLRSGEYVPFSKYFDKEILGGSLKGGLFTGTPNFGRESVSRSESKIALRSNLGLSLDRELKLESRQQNGLALGLASKNTLKEDYLLSTKSKSAYALDQLLRQRQAQRQIQRQVSEQRQILRPTSPLITKTTTTSTPVFQEPLKGNPPFKPFIKRPPKEPPRTPPPPIIKPLLPFVRKETKEYGTKSKLSKLGFDVFSKIKGKQVKIGSAYTKEAGLDFGAEFLKSKLAATFSLRPSKSVAKISKTTGAFTKYSSEFRTYKIKKGKKIPLEDTFIQKRGTRLGTRSEVNLLQGSRRGGFF